ncbi:MAG TPA: DUF2585 family protein [Pyrinomonadaceae bacterium]|nr:DUF2585 family protein [Pyrinomonadaceae bacterium]
MTKSPPQTYPRQTFIIFLILITAALILNLQGRVWWCQAGDISPWSWQVLSRHNSQHLIDPYSFTHVLHGVLEFWLIGLVFRKVPPAWRFVIAIGIEGSWEVIENTNYVINRYREATISLNYFGDSIANSLSDMMCCGVGFLTAHKIGRWWSLALFVATEIVLLFWIRDSLLLNILMLIWPVDGVKHWQIGG